MCFLIHSLSNIAFLYICVICGFLEGLREDWFHQMSDPRKIKNLLTYLLTNLLTYLLTYLYVPAKSVNTHVVITLFIT